MKIIAVCGFGVGSSVIAKMNIESILDEENKSSDATVETVDLSVFMLLDAFYSFPECWYKGISGFLFPFIFGCFFPPVHKMCT
ncbi:PTS sugar transporter subunit IIB, partial [Lacticaseibacillus rhamnosus]|uniref:PTS sugar transporter subunit IIB n=1 Tax=Lacticaseibacillus rhamnosus TaxID=47715 RepID=UPI00238AC2A2|nr:hypothetical protein [Lacticaseibacillus rhamnosus]